MTTTATAEIAADLGDLWSLWTEPRRMQAWLPVDSATGPLRAGAEFRWDAAAPFVTPVRTTGRVRRLEPCALLELDLDMLLSPNPSTVTIELARDPGGATSSVQIRHTDLPDDDLGLFESNGYGHYWRQHLESLTACAERRPSDHHHRLHTGVYFVGGHPALGVLVGGVVTGSPVHDAGLQAGDVVRAVDGVPVRSIVEYDEWLDAATPGAAARFSLARTELVVQLPEGQ